MSEQGHSLHHRQGFCSPGIERNSYEEKLKHDKCILLVREAEIGLRNVDNRLNEGGHDEHATGYAGQPA
jgi:hypothetical protein